MQDEIRTRDVTAKVWGCLRGYDKVKCVVREIYWELLMVENRKGRQRV